MEEIIEKLRRIFRQRFPESVAQLEPTVFAERTRKSGAEAAPTRNQWLEDLAEKLKRALSGLFAGSVLELDPVDPGAKMSGSLLWSGFEAAEQLDRQRQVNRVLRKELTPKERQHVSIIFTLTPEEAAAMREG